MEAFNEVSMTPTAHGHPRPEHIFPPPQQQEGPLPGHLIATTGYPPPPPRTQSQPNTPFDKYIGSGPPVTMRSSSSSTPQPPEQVQFKQPRFPQTSRIVNSPVMPPPPPPQPPRRPVTTVPGGGFYQQQQISQAYPPGVQMGPGPFHQRQYHYNPVQNLQPGLQQQRQLLQQQQQPQQHQRQHHPYAVTNGLTGQRPHSTQTPPMYRPPPAKRAPPPVAPPGTINPSDLQQAPGPVPVQMPGPARPASNPPAPVPQQFQQPLQPPCSTIDPTPASPTTSSLTNQPRPHVRSTPPFVQQPQGTITQQAPQRDQQQQQHPAEYQRQQTEYRRQLQYRQQLQRQMRSLDIYGDGGGAQFQYPQQPQPQSRPPSSNVQSGGGGEHFQNPQQLQSQPQQQLLLSFVATNSEHYTQEEFDKDVADLATQLWFPELENQYFPNYAVPTWTDPSEPGPNDPELPLETYYETDPELDLEPSDRTDEPSDRTDEPSDETDKPGKRGVQKPALVEDWLLDKTGALTIPEFYVPCEFCTWLRVKTGTGGHCFPSFAVRDATRVGHEDSAPGRGRRGVTLHNGAQFVRPKCTTCVGFGIETCTIGDNTKDNTQINPAREAAYTQNPVVRGILSKPLEETAVTGATDVEMQDADSAEPNSGRGPLG